MLSFVKKHLFYFTYFPGILLLGASIVYFNQEVTYAILSISFHRITPISTIF